MLISDLVEAKNPIIHKAFKGVQRVVVRRIPRKKIQNNSLIVAARVFPE